MKKFKLKETAAIAALTTSILFSACSSSNKETKELKAYLEESNYEGASRYYSRNSEKIKYKSITEDLSAAIDEVYDDYIEKKASMKDTVDNLNFLASMCEEDLEDDINEKLEEIEKIEAARQNFEQAESLYKSGSYMDAISYYSRLTSGDENYDEAQSRISDCKESYKLEVLSDADSYAASGDYESAINTLKDAQLNLKDTPEFAEKIKEYEDSMIKATLESADALASSGDYESAIRKLKDAQNTLGNLPEFASKISEYEDALIESELATAYTEIANGQYYEAIVELAKLEAKYPDNEKIKKLRADTEASYLNQVLTQMDEYISKGDIQNALAVGNKALNILPNSPEINAKLAQIESLKPLPMSEIPISESAYFDQLKDMNTTYKDSVDNIYSPGNLFKIHKHDDGWGNDEAGYAKIYTNSQYKKLQGTVAVADSSETCTGALMIYADEKLVYSEEFDRSTAPKAINIDITGAEWIEIRLNYAATNTSGTVELLLSEFGFYKQ